MQFPQWKTAPLEHTQRSTAYLQRSFTPQVLVLVFPRPSRSVSAHSCDQKGTVERPHRVFLWCAHDGYIEHLSAAGSNENTIFAVLWFGLVRFVKISISFLRMHPKQIWSVANTRRYVSDARSVHPLPSFRAQGSHGDRFNHLFARCVLCCVSFHIFLCMIVGCANSLITARAALCFMSVAGVLLVY